MNSLVIPVVIPGFVSVLLFLVFTYLHEQSRQAYFPRMATGVGSLLCCITFWMRFRFTGLPPAFLVKLAVFGGNGAVHFCFHAADARPLPVPLV